MLLCNYTKPGSQIELIATVDGLAEKFIVNQFTLKSFQRHEVKYKRYYKYKFLILVGYSLM